VVILTPVSLTENLTATLLPYCPIFSLVVRRFNQQSDVICIFTVGSRASRKRRLMQDSISSVVECTIPQHLSRTSQAGPEISSPLLSSSANLSLHVTAPIRLEFTELEHDFVSIPIPILMTAWTLTLTLRLVVRKEDVSPHVLRD
jgi:hypothetical protein